MEDDLGCVATAILLSKLYTSLGELAETQRISAFLEIAQKAFPEELWTLLQEDSESVRQESIAAARERFAGSGRGLYDPPG
ncbi:hypothetical protein WME94_07350 [Sorangium sp. So ce429]